MENRENFLATVLCCGITALLAITLAVNGVQSLMGHARFAYWHLGSLAMMAFFSMVQLDENPEVEEWFINAYRVTRKWLQVHSRTITRAVAAAALFIFRPFNNHRPQTEP